MVEVLKVCDCIFFPNINEVMLYTLLSIWLLSVKNISGTFNMDYSATEKPPAPFNCSVYTHEEEFEVHCRGNGLTAIPSNLNASLNKLIISESRDITVVTSKSMEPYKARLQDVVLSDLPNLRVIEEGSFSNISSLRTIYIYNTPQIKFIYGLLKGVTSKHFRSLRIVNTGLHEVPELFYLSPENTLFLLDLDHNKIEKLTRNSIRVTAQQVTLNFNEIGKIEDYAFNGSEIGKLHITGNPKLSELGEFAFGGIRNLRELDLSQTSITILPDVGLELLEKLKIRDTPSLHIIPSLYDMQGLRTAKLTHHFHCCAFKYPQEHNPTKHAAYQTSMRQACIKNQIMDKTKELTKMKRSIRYPNYDQDQFPLEKTMKSPNAQIPLTGQFIGHQEPRETIDEVEEDLYEDFGVFHSSPTMINSTPIEIYCGNVSFKLQDVKCDPEPNALNPCEDIMGFTWLRNSVWFVVILAVVGNVAVIIVIWFSKTEVNVSRFLMCHLAFADLCMGLYLLLIASMDYHSVGTYFNFAYDWQYGIGCQIAGFLTVFAGHLSIFTLTVVTLERWFAIKYAIDLTKRIRLKTAVEIMIVGWIYSILMGMLPLLGINKYSSTSICLPMEVESVLNKAYLYIIFIINGISLALIVFFYAQIYFSLGYETRRASHKGEMTIAKKMALLIFTDFATYTPVAFFGMCALIGYPLINITKSKILLVFFYPLNACANPYLYALMTSQYRRDLYLIISRCGLCKNKAQKYCLKDDMPMTKPSPLLPRQESVSQCCNNHCKQNGSSSASTNTFV